MKPEDLWTSDFASMPVYKDPYISKVDEDGNKILARVFDGKVFVHPDHWDEFVEKLRGIANAPGQDDEP